VSDSVRVRQEKKFETDYFAYLDSKENSFRYSIPIDFARNFLDSELDLIDLCCGSGSASKSLSDIETYTGYDHNEVAISNARYAYSAKNRNFQVLDIVESIESIDFSSCNVVSLFGAVFHLDSINTGNKYSGGGFLKQLVNQLEDETLVILQSSFPFTDHPSSNLFLRGLMRSSKLSELFRNISCVNLIQSIQSVSVGLEKIVGDQKNQPSWFISDKAQYIEDLSKGHYLGNIVHILKVNRL